MKFCATLFFCGLIFLTNPAQGQAAECDWEVSTPLFVYPGLYCKILPSMLSIGKAQIICLYLIDVYAWYDTSLLWYLPRMDFGASAHKTLCERHFVSLNI